MRRYGALIIIGMLLSLTISYPFCSSPTAKFFAFSQSSPWLSGVKKTEDLKYWYIEGCKGNVEVRTLTGKEYAALLNHTINMIDGWGNSQLAGYELRPGTFNTSAMIIGPDGRPHLLYDILKGEVVSPYHACHLDRFVATGQVAYTAELAGNERFCVGDAEECKKGLPTKKEIDKSAGALSAIQTAQNTFMESNKTNWEALANGIKEACNKLGKKCPVRLDNLDGLVKNAKDGNKDAQDQIVDMVFKVQKSAAALLDYSPTTFVAADSHDIASGGAQNVLLMPQTIYDFITTIRVLTPWESYIRVLSIIEAAVGIKQAAKAVGETKGIIKGPFRTLKEYFKRGGRLKTFSTEIDEITGLSKYGDDLADMMKAGKKLNEGEALSKLKQIEAKLKGLLSRNKNIEKIDIDVKNYVKLKGGELKEVNGIEIYVKSEGKTFKYFYRYDNGEWFRYIPSRDEYWSISKLGLKPPLDDLTLKQLETLRKVEVAKSLGTQDLDILAKDLKSYSIKTDWASLFKMAGTKTGKFMIFWSRFLKTASGKLLVAFGTINWWTSLLVFLDIGTQWLPYLQSSMAVFHLDSSTKEKLKEAQYMTIKRQKGIKTPQGSAGIFEVYETFFGARFPDKAAINHQTGPLVQIFDTEASRSSEKTTVTGIYSGRWVFSTQAFKDETQTYTFEHPSTSVPDKVSTLPFRIINTDLWLMNTSYSQLYNTPLGSALPFLRSIRTALGVAVIYTLPISAGVMVTEATGSLMYGIISGALTAVGTAPISVPIPIPYVTTLPSLTSYWLHAVNPVRAKAEGKLCSQIFDEGEKNTIWGLEYARAGFQMAATVTQFAPGVGQVANIILDIAEMILEWYQSKYIADIADKLQTCADSAYEGIAIQHLPTQSELAKFAQEALKPIRGALNALSTFSPEAAQGVEQFINSLTYQILHFRGVHTDVHFATTTAKKLYYVHFYDADIRWFRSPDCELQFCDLVGPAQFKCIIGKGYTLLDENGNPILEDVPQALSMRINMEQGYGSIVQQVINVKKGDGLLMEIDKDGIKEFGSCGKSDSGECLLETLKVFFHTKDEEKIKEKFGKLEEIVTNNTYMWFDGNELLVQFINPVGKYRAYEVIHFDNANIKIERDGTITVNNESLDNLGDGAIVFENALIRSGFDKYKDWFHIFIYDLAHLSTNNLKSISIAELCGDESYKGMRLNVSLEGIENPSDLAQLIKDICFTDFYDTTTNNSIHIRDNQVCFTIEGEETCYDIVGAKDGKLELSRNGQTYYLSAGVDEKGNPYLQLLDRVGNPVSPPIYMMVGNGLGGSWMFNPNTGTISIKNEYMFPLNPNFQLYGAGGTYWMAPETPPWDERERGVPTAGVSAPKPNLLAQLPTVNEKEITLYLTLLSITLVALYIVSWKRKQ